MARTIDWKALCYAADEDMKKPLPTYKMGRAGKRLFYGPESPYANFAYGIGHWAVGSTLVVAPDNLTAQETLDWIHHGYQDSVDAAT